jgi:hypothetical protein
VKTLVVVADRHTGHRAGLTPPDWQWPIRKGPDRRRKWGQSQREAWNAYQELREKIGPADVVIDAGDAIDGRGEASGSTELVIVDRHEQCEAAKEALHIWDAKKIVMARGTGYHTGGYEDYEDLIAHALNAEIASHPFVQVEGVTFDVKHHVGGSQVPHGRYTALARDHLWNALWAEREEQPKAQVLLRAHVHYFAVVGGRGWTAMVLPALQLAGTKYGARRFSGTVDWGLVVFRIEGGAYSWTEHTRGLKANVQEMIVIP